RRRTRPTDHPADLSAPPYRALKGGLESGHLILAPHEFGKAACPRHVETTAHPPDPFELEHTHWLRHTPHLVSPQIVQSEEPLTCLSGRLRKIDPPRLRNLLHPRRDVGRMPERRVVHAEVIHDLPDHDLSRVEPHPHREVDPLPDAQLICIAAQRIA